MLKKILCVIACCALSVMGGCGSMGGAPAVSGETAETEKAEDGTVNENYLAEIKKRGYLTVGCKMDVPGLGLYDEETDEWSGLEVELAYRTAANVFGVSLEEAKEKDLAEIIGVTVADREEKLEKGEVDCLFATYTITEERAERFAFSESYYTDYIGLMVKSSGENANSLGTGDIKSIADLDGKYIGVPRNATTREVFLKYIDTMNTVKVSPIFCEYESYEVLFQALKDGNIDVMAVDVGILSGYVDSSTVILKDRFGGQHYGAAVKKENALLLDCINEAIEN